MPSESPGGRWEWVLCGVLSGVRWEGHASGFAALGWLIGVLTANAGVNELVIGVVVLLVVCLVASGTSRSQRTEAAPLH